MKNLKKGTWVGVGIFLLSRGILNAVPNADRDLTEFGFVQTLPPTGLAVFTLLLSWLVVLFLLFRNFTVENFEKMRVNFMDLICMLFASLFFSLIVFGVLIYPVWALYALLN